VRFVRSVFVPEDEICLHVYQAACADDVSEAARLAGLPFEHIAKAVTQTKGESS
jgi:hypothetical protein